MPKRDAAQLGAEEEKEGRGAKQPRCSEEAKDVTAAAAAAASAASSSCDWLVSAPSNCGFLIVGVDTFSADPALTQARTRQLVSATRRDGSLTERMQATCALLQADGERAESLLDMSLRVDGEEVGSVCALFYLLRLLAETASQTQDASNTLKLKEEAAIAFGNAAVPLLPRLLASFDPAITDAASGNNALHELLSRAVPNYTTAAFYQTLEALIRHGVDVNRRNNSGRTVALCPTPFLGPYHVSGCGLRLLLKNGADISPRDNNGNTLLHCLINSEAWSVLRGAIGDGDELSLSGLDLFTPNRTGRTPLDYAAIHHAKKDNENSWRIHALIQARVDKWQAHTRPAVLSALSEPLIPDLAKIVLGYVDGSGPAFAAQGDKMVE